MIINLEELKNKYNPKGIFLCGSKMFGIDNYNSDTDLIILVNNSKDYQNFKDYENNIDYYFIDINKIASKPNKNPEYSFLQLFFLEKEHILYKAEDFDFKKFINEIKQIKKDLLYKFAKNHVIRLKFDGYCKIKAKLYYHILYLSFLIKEDTYLLTNEEKETLKRIKEFKATQEDKEFLYRQLKKFYKFYLHEQDIREDW